MSLLNRVGATVKVNFASDRMYAVCTAGVPMVVSLIQVPILTRSLSPTQFGLWATAIAIASFVQQADLGVGYSMFRFMVFGHAQSGDSGIWPYLRISWLFYPALALVAAAVAYPWRSPLIHRLEAAHVNAAPILVLILLLCASYPISNAALRAFQAAGEFRRAALVISVTQLVYAVLMVGAFLGSFMSVALPLIAQLTQSMIVAILGLRRFRVKDRVPWRGIGLRRFFVFSRRVFVVNLAGAAMLQLPILLIAGAVSSRQVGIYALISLITISLRNLPLMSMPPLVRSMRGSPSEIVLRSQVVIKVWRKTVILWGPVAFTGVAIGVPLLGGRTYIPGILPGLLLFAGHYVSLWGAAHTATAQQLLMNRTESWASGLALFIDIGILLASRGSLGLYAPGVALLISQAFCLMLYLVQYRGFLRRSWGGNADVDAFGGMHDDA